MTSYDAILLTESGHSNLLYRGYGAHRLASQLRDNGFSCLVLDFCANLTFDMWIEICKYAVGSNTKFIGISSTWLPYRTPHLGVGKSLNPGGNNDVTLETLYPNKGFTYDLILGQIEKWFQEAKKYNPKIKTLMGGPKIDCYSDLPIDHFIVGLAETEIIDFLTDQKRLWPKFINHDENAQAKTWDFALSRTHYQEEDGLFSDEILSLEFTRGCRFKCAYCSYPLIGQKELSKYIKDKDSLYRELMENYDRWGITKYSCADDTLNDSIEKLEHIASVTRRLPFKIKLQAYTRIDVMVMQPQQLDLLKEIGLVSTWIGLETLHEKSSKIIGKGMDPEKRKTMLVDMNSKWGDDIFVDAGYIVGLPYEDSESVRNAVEFSLQKDNIIGHLQLQPLIINPKDGLFPYTTRSDMDLNHEKYGYSIPDKSKRNFWSKDDNTDITSMTDAINLTYELQKYLDTHEAKTKTNFFAKPKELSPEIYYQNLLTVLKKNH
jgi:hypothetical protein